MTETISAPAIRVVMVNEYEAFWLDCIRVSHGGEVPRPTLARAQALRRIFAIPGQNEAGSAQR